MVQIFMANLNGEDEDLSDIFSFANLLYLAAEFVDYFFIFIQQIVLIFLKNCRQKWVNGRNSIKSTIIAPVVVLAFSAFVCVVIIAQPTYPASYEIRGLPPLSTESKVLNAFL